MVYTLPDKTLISLPTGAVKHTVNSLGRRIIEGTYETGTLLPKEDDFVNEFNVSRTVIREAIKVLSGKGLIRTARRYGSRVCSFEDWNLLDPDVIRWHHPDCPLAARIYKEAFELRYIFEPEAAALAAANASQEQRDTILDAAKSIFPLDGGPIEIGADYVFHATILQASGNLMLSQLQNLIHAVLVFSVASGRKGAPGVDVSRRIHIAVAEAIAAHDPKAARALMAELLSLNDAVADVIFESQKE